MRFLEVRSGQWLAAFALVAAACWVPAGEAHAQDEDYYDLSGAWEFTIVLDGTPHHGEMILDHRGQRISGAWRPRDQTAGESDVRGRYEYGSLNLTFRLTIGGEEVEIRLRGRVSDDTAMSGPATVGDKTGTWEAFLDE